MATATERAAASMIAQDMATRRALLALTAPCAVLGLLIGVGRPLQIVVAIIAVGVSVVLTVATNRGLETLLENALLVNAFLVPMNGLRLGSLMTLSDALLLVACPLLLMTRLLTAGKSFLPSYRPFLSCLALISFGGLLATALSSDPLHGLPGLIRFFMSTIVVLVVFALWAPQTYSLRRAVWAYVIGASVSVLVGLVQDTSLYSGRSYGLSTHPNHLGVTSVLACGGAIAIATTTKGLARKAALGMSAIVVVGIVLSGSRAALLGLVVTFVAFLVAGRDWRLLRLGIVIATVMVIGAVFASSRLPTVNAVGRLFGADTGAQASDQQRRDLLETNLARIRQHPVTGSGFEFALEAHSLYLQLWASAGLIGLAGLLFLFARTARLLLTVRADPFTSALLSAFIGYLTIGVISNILWDRYVWTFLAFGLASAARAQRGRGIGLGHREERGTLSPVLESRS